MKVPMHWGEPIQLPIKPSNRSSRCLASTSLLAFLVTGSAISIVSLLAASSQVPVQAQAPVTGSVYQNQAALGQPAGPENVMIILDSSYSMDEKVGGGGGETKMNAAKRSVLQVLQNLGPNTRVGLRVYGNSANSFTACRATDVLAPIGDNNRNLIASKMIGIKPTGLTPISYAVERSLREDFLGLSGRKSIILISDGIETCGEDPCNVAVRMQQSGINVKINVVGFGLQDYAAVRQLKCVALATKGNFYSANTAADLANSLNKAMAVETKVQGTILTPAAQGASATSPATSEPVVPVKAPEASPPPSEKLLRAAPARSQPR